MPLERLKTASKTFLALLATTLLGLLFLTIVGLSWAVLALLATLLWAVSSVALGFVMLYQLVMFFADSLRIAFHLVNTLVNRVVGTGKR